MRRPARPAGHTLGNDKLAVSFDGKNGELIGIRNLDTGNEYLQLAATGGNPFAVYYDFTGLFDVVAPQGGTPRLATEPSAITRAVFDPRQAEKVTFRQREGKTMKRLTVSYASRVWKADLTFSLAMGSHVVECDLKLTNVDTIPASCLCVFPFLSGIKLAGGRQSKMVCMNEAGSIRPLWCDHEGGIYGNAAQTSMQWGSVFDMESRDALGFIIRDRDLKNKDIRYRRPSIEVRYFPPEVLFPGATLRYPRAALLVTTGDWKPTAEAYHRWFIRAFPPAVQPPWVRALDSHLAQWLRKRKVGEDASGEAGLGSHLKSFHELPDVYRRLPVSSIEFAFHGEGCSRPRRIGGEIRYRHADGDNVVRRDMGGVAALRAGIRKVHDLGMRFSFTVDGYVVPFEARLVSERGAASWAVMNSDGTPHGSYTREGFLHMCPGCVEWQEHLATSAARLVRDTGADGLRLDSLGFYFYPCYNPAHRHRSPWDYNTWMVELLGRVSRAVRAARPDCLLTTEAAVDFYAPHFGGALTQAWHPSELVAVTNDVAPMRVALPEYCVIAHNPCGPLAAALSGYPGGSGGLEPGGRFTTLDRLWRSVRFAAAETIRWGSASRPAPRASRPDVQCRLFSGSTMDVVIGARPDLRRKASDYRTSRGLHLNADIDTRKDRVAYTVSVDTAGRSPRALYMYDVETLRLGSARVALRDGSATLATRSSWFMAVLCYGKPPIATAIETEEPLAPGKRCVLHIWAFGPDGVISARAGKSLPARLWIPGLGIGEGTRIRVPGDVVVPVPRDAAPGSYVCTLKGPGLLGCMRFLEVR